MHSNYQQSEAGRIMQKHEKPRTGEKNPDFGDPLPFGLGM